MSGDEYFDLSDKETTRDGSGNRGRKTNFVKVEVLSYLNERRKKLSVLKVYPRVMKVFRKCNFIIISSASHWLSTILLKVFLEINLGNTSSSLSQFDLYYRFCGVR